MGQGQDDEEVPLSRFYEDLSPDSLVAYAEIAGIPDKTLEGPAKTLAPHPPGSPGQGEHGDSRSRRKAGLDGAVREYDPLGSGPPFPRTHPPLEKCAYRQQVIEPPSSAPREEDVPETFLMQKPQTQFGVRLVLCPIHQDGPCPGIRG